MNSNLESTAIWPQLTISSVKISNDGFNNVIENYGRVIEDSVEAMRLNPTFIKPYFRCAQAYLTLEKYEECIKMADKGLEVYINTFCNIKLIGRSKL